ncbi:MAG: nucleotidyltransferase family protein [Novosphingobium sp.]
MVADRRPPWGSEAFRALLALTDPWIADADPARLRRIEALGDVDWAEVLAHARRHRVVPLAAHRLEALGPAAGVPAPVAAEFRREAKAALFHEMAMFGELCRIKAALDGETVPFLVIKGMVLSSEGHGRMGLRVNHDIDLVVSPGDLDRGHGALTALGYRRAEPEGDPPSDELARWVKRSKDWVYILPSNGTVVELHHRLFDNRTLCDPGVMRRARAVMLFGQVEVMTLGEEDEPAYLALHGALHAWSRLKWLLDMAIIARKLGPEGTSALLSRQRKQPAERALRQAFLLCSELFETEHPVGRKAAPLSVRLLVAAARRALNGEGATELEATRFGTSIKNASHYLLWCKPAYLAAELAFDLTDMSRDQDATGGKVPIWFNRPLAWLVRHRR